MFTRQQHTFLLSRRLKYGCAMAASAQMPRLRGKNSGYCAKHMASACGQMGTPALPTAHEGRQAPAAGVFQKGLFHPFAYLRHAFTLGEVLVAMTLFTLLVVAVGQNIGNNMRALAQMDSGGWDTPSMRAIREHILNRRSREEIEEGGEIELAGWPKPGDTASTAAAQPTKVRWTAEINPTSTLDLYTLTVELQVDSSDDPIEASFITHVYRPGWGRLEDRERMVEAKIERLEAVRTARGEKRKENQ